MSDLDCASDCFDEVETNFPAHQVGVDIWIAFAPQPGGDLLHGSRLQGQFECALDHADGRADQSRSLHGSRRRASASKYSATATSADDPCGVEARLASRRQEAACSRRPLAVSARVGSAITGPGGRPVQLRVRDPGGIAFCKLPVRHARTAARGVAGHVKGNRISLIEIIEVDDLAPYAKAGARLSLSVAQVLVNINRAIISYTTEVPLHLIADLFLAAAFNLPNIVIYKRGYQSQIDGFWRFAAPLSFYSLLLARNPTSGFRH